jgi:tripartite-type tricarboxylate transporter receptor subunit TctC
MCNPGEAITFVKAGNMRFLGVMAAERDPGFKDVPTFKEMGADVTSGTWRGLAVPKGTPKEVSDKLAQAFEKASKDPKFVDFMQKRNLGIYYLDAAKYKAFIENDEKVLKEIADYLKTQKK